MDRFVELASEARTGDDVFAILDDLTAQGVTAVPVALGRHGRPEGVFLTFPVLELAAPAIGKVQRRPLGLQEAVEVDETQSPEVFFASILTRISRGGSAAEPVAISRHGEPRGAVISTDLFGEISRDIDRAQALHVTARRLGQLPSSTPPDEEFNNICRELGADPEEVRQSRSREADEILVSGDPPWAEK